MTKFEGTIIVEGGDVFIGTREQFQDCFFTNISRESVQDWAKSNGWTVEFYEGLEPLAAFTEAVLKRMSNRLVQLKVSEEDQALDRECGIPSMFREGFSVPDAVRYLRCMEHWNPELDEEVALRRMFEIRRKYVKDLVLPDYAKDVVF